MAVLVTLSLVLCTVNFVYLLQNGVDVQEALSFTIVLLVASIPLAIEIVTTTTLAIGSKALAKHGAIVAKIRRRTRIHSFARLCSVTNGKLCPKALGHRRPRWYDDFVQRQDWDFVSQ